MRNKPVFKVIIENWGRGIEFRNFFEFGQWGPIKRELVKLKKELIKTHEKNFRPTKIDMAAMKKTLRKSRMIISLTQSLNSMERLSFVIS